ncbi:MAG: transcription termination/antitermination factor NusG [Aeriscardovia sp.]|nr:transcription termination/antitermination factor NusG [Aeriscardovia sp.]
MDEESKEDEAAQARNDGASFSSGAESIQEMAKRIADEAVGRFEKTFDDDAEQGCKWYALNTYSGYEKRVKHNIEGRTRNYHEDNFSPSDYVMHVEVPLEDVEQHTEKGKKNIEGRVRIPGYVLICIKPDENKRIFKFVQETEGVTSFAGVNQQPVALTKREVMDMMTPYLRHEAIKAAKLNSPDKVMEVKYKVGENVNIITDPFAGFHGVISEVSPEMQRLEVIISAFGRDMPISLEFDKVQKIEEA